MLVLAREQRDEIGARVIGAFADVLDRSGCQCPEVLAQTLVRATEHRLVRREATVAEGTQPVTLSHWILLLLAYSRYRLGRAAATVGADGSGRGVVSRPESPPRSQPRSTPRILFSPALASFRSSSSISTPMRKMIEAV